MGLPYFNTESIRYNFHHFYILFQLLCWVTNHYRMHWYTAVISYAHRLCDSSLDRAQQGQLVSVA